MEDLQILGPAQGTFLCILSEDRASTRVHIQTKEAGSGFVGLSGGGISREFTAGGHTDSHRVFLLETPEINLKENLDSAQVT